MWGMVLARWRSACTVVTRKLQTRGGQSYTHRLHHVEDLGMALVGAVRPDREVQLVRRWIRDERLGDAKDRIGRRLLNV